MAVMTNDKAVKSRAFSVVALKIQAKQTKTTKLTTPTVQISPCPPEIGLLLYPGVHALPGVHLQLFSVNLTGQFFPSP